MLQSDINKRQLDLKTKLTGRERHILACCNVLKRNITKDTKDQFIDKIEKLVLKMIKS